MKVNNEKKVIIILPLKSPPYIMIVNNSSTHAKGLAKFNRLVELNIY